jgi:hypothetical protein
MDPRSHTTHTTDPGVPEALSRDLRAAFGGVPPLPPGFDDRVLGAATARLAARRNRRTLGLRLSAGAGIAAAIALSAAVWLAPMGPSPRGLGIADADDVNRDGVVNVLDAMALALVLERTGDADDADVRRVMARIVRLDDATGGQS